MIYEFHVCIHPLARSAIAGPAVEISGRRTTTLNVPADEAHTPHRVTFDRCAEMLATLPRMFIEPDGSFVWTGNRDGARWQIDGVLYDQGPQLAYAQVSGRAPPDEFDQLLAAFGWPAAPLMFQVLPAGVFIGEAELRRACAT